MLSPYKAPILCLDFDGVLHSYISGWKGPTEIPDEPVNGAMQFICKVLNGKHFRLSIYSARSGHEGGIAAMKAWLFKHLQALVEGDEAHRIVIDDIEWPTEKPSAFVTIDDRALQFTGVWPQLDDLKKFAPWNKPNPNVLAPPKALSRNDIDEVFKTIADVEKRLQTMPYCEATQAMSRLEAIREIIGECLPGGLFEYACEECGMPFGNDDNFGTVADIYLCVECAPSDAPIESACA